MSGSLPMPRALAGAVDSMRHRIRAGHYRPGSKLPAETNLARDLGLSRGTIRRAIDVLVSMGELRREPHSRPIVSDRAVISHAAVERDVLVWVSHPVADGTVLAALKGISRALGGTPYRLVVREPSRFVGQVVKADERNFILDLIDRPNFAGAILWRDPFAQNDDLLRRLAEVGPPLVYIDIPPPSDGEGDFVGTANAAAARTCVEHLIEQGHSRIVFVADATVAQPTQERIRGYWRAMQAAGIEGFGQVIVASDLPTPARPEPRVPGTYSRFSTASGYFSGLAHRAVEHMLTREPRPTAVFASHDVLALNLCALLEGSGLRVPEDVAVVGFDWLADCERSFPDTLTTAAQNFESIGLHAADLILDRLAGELSPTPRHVLLEAPLIVRSSTASDLLLPAAEPAISERAGLP